MREKTSWVPPRLFVPVDAHEKRRGQTHAEASSLGADGLRCRRRRVDDGDALRFRFRFRFRLRFRRRVRSLVPRKLLQAAARVVCVVAQDLREALGHGGERAGGGDGALVRRRRLRKSLSLVAAETEGLRRGERLFHRMQRDPQVERRVPLVREHRVQRPRREPQDTRDPSRDAVKRDALARDAR